jgi:hypothetical protein
VRMRPEHELELYSQMKQASTTAEAHVDERNGNEWQTMQANTITRLR